ncbi:lysophospholipase-like protein 1 isoform X1 [Neodiprion virginianus]|uniref:lysophospholipase-like protein 1 isoform X1 n=1 Tax=Neodiprion virginianus TaxID=2961670 RepID=UPI001EE724DC|nr:lysophospholipase-like protein 1 isoform X1 [Neodiprion virginianus]
MINVMAAVTRISKLHTIQATANHTATLIFFHGSGDTGNNVKDWIKLLNKEELKFPHIKIVYPTAPLQPYTPNNGEPSNVWFDRSAISKSAPELQASIDSMCSEVSGIVEKEIACGIPVNRIVLGGFSMGGALSLHMAYRHRTSVAGCCAMSSFLNDNSLVYEALKTATTGNTPPVLQFHGVRDDLVPIEWGEETFKLLTELGVKGEFVPLKNAYHELTKLEVQKFKEWLLNVIPEESS